MKRISILLTAILLFFIPNKALAEQAQALHTLWDIPWDSSADTFEKLAYENAHVTFEREDSKEIIRFTSETGNIPLFDWKAQSASVSFLGDMLNNIILSFPKRTADVTDIGQMQDTVEESIQDLYDKWSVLTKEYGSVTYAQIYLATDDASAPCYKVPMSDDSIDLITIRNILWEALYASGEFNMQIVWNNVELEWMICPDDQASTVGFSLLVSYHAYVHSYASRELIEYPLP